MWNAIERQMTLHTYDIAHVFGGIQVYEFRHAVARLPNIIVPYESHSLFLENALRGTRSPRERLRLRASLALTRRYERIMYRGFERVVVLAASDQRTLNALDPSLPVAVIPLGVNLVDAPRRPVGSHEIVFVGNFAYAPNVMAALSLANDVLPRVLASIPDARLALVGADPPSEVAALASNCVEVTGLVPDVQPYLGRAQAFVAPIGAGAGAKNKILEALAAGLPVVTTPLGCEGFAVNAGEHLLIGTTAAEIADATVRILRDSSLADRLGAAGRQLVRARYTWPDIVARYEMLYEDVIAGRRADAKRSAIDAAYRSSVK
jgi:glycosyltransferase involved in cell wall biosynthesis